jgi:hypothetical protein
MTAIINHYLSIDIHKLEAQVPIFDDEGEVGEKVRVQRRPRRTRTEVRWQ